MRIARTIVALLALVMAGSWNRGPVIQAGPGEKVVPKISDSRPFLVDTPDWQVASNLATLAAKGDKEALAELESAGLTYTPIMLGVPALRLNAYKLLRAHAGWVRAIQGWEAALVMPDPEGVKTAYLELKDRFWRSETQLARAILHAHACGAPDVAADLAALDADSPWVQAAQAHCGLKFTGVEAMKKMRAIEVDAADTARWHFLFSGPLVLGPELKRGQNQTDVERAWARENFGTATGIREFESVPRQWRYGGLHERIGAIAIDTLTPDQIEAMDKEVFAANKDLFDGQTSVNAWAFSALAEIRDMTQADRQHLAGTARLSRGAAAIPFALWCVNNGMPTEGMAFSLLAFHGTPEGTLPQRLVLSQAAGSGDEKLLALAARAILALAPDNVDSYRNILRGLYRIAGFEPLRDAYHKALVASGDKDLVALAGMVKDGKWEVLNPRDRRPLTLPDAVQAKLLSVFCHADELAAHGGAEAVLWLNRAVFLEGARKLVAADAAYRKAIQLSCGKAPAAMHPNIYQFFMFRLRNLGPAMRAVYDARWKKHDPEGFAALSALDSAWSSSGATTTQAGPMAAFRQWQVRPDPLPESLAKELKDGKDKWGGPAHVALGRACFDQGDYAGYRAGLEAAQRTSPLDFDLYYQFTPRGEPYMSNSFANWETLACNTWRLTMLHPFSNVSQAWMTLVAHRTGVYGICADAACNAGLTRAPYVYWGEDGYTMQTYRYFGRNYHWRAYARLGMASQGLLSQSQRDEMTQVFDVVSFSLQAYYFLDIANAFGLLPNFAKLTYGEMAAAYNMKDVSTLLDIARNLARTDAQTAIDLVKRADDLGVSEYGRFVGTQTLCMAHARLGTLDDVWARYTEMRGGEVGVPKYLDNYMLAGATSANQHALLPRIIEAVEGYGPAVEDSEFAYYWRRAHMAAGRHDKLAAMSTGNGTKAFHYRNFRPYTLLFHEARALLAAGQSAELIKRTDPYLVEFVEGTLGEYADAAILREIAVKLSESKDSPFPTAVADRITDGDRVLDYQVISTLAGRRKGPLPESGPTAYWHGTRWAERPPAFQGGGRATAAEMIARDHFMRGALAWLAGDNATAITKLKECVTADQRCSHEYHVAEWLLANPLKPKEGK